MKFIISGIIWIKSKYDIIASLILILNLIEYLCKVINIYTIK